MEVLERTLVAIPSGQPAHVLMLSSSYGYRHDPFTGASAMHSGLDFPGPRGTPILAAAPGRVAFVGRRSGYGNVVEEIGSASCRERVCQFVLFSFFAVSL